MMARRSDLPLNRDAISRFLPWLIAFMVYLAVLAVAGTLALGAVAARWDSGMGGTLTVQIVPSAKPAKNESAKAGTDRERVGTALEILRATPGVAKAESIDDGRIMALLEPWLGSTGFGDDLPIPRLIDVEKEPGANLDTLTLSKRLADAVPGATIDDHRVWLDRLIRLIQTVKALGVSVVILIGFAAIGTVVFATRTGLAIHQDVIEVLHMIGAHDSYIARQFAGHAFTLGLRGGLLGLLLAVPTLLGIGSLASQTEFGPVPELSLAPVQWASLVVLPALAAIIAMLTARITVTRTLARMF